MGSSTRRGAGAGSDRIGSDRIGSDRIGSDRIGSDRIGSDRLDRFSPDLVRFQPDRFLQRRSWRFVLAPLALALAALTGAPAAAQEVPATAAAAAPALAEYRIPAGSLADALHEFSQQSGIQVFFESDLVRGKTVPALSGRWDLQQVLTQLLEGSGLHWQYVNDKTLVLRRTDAAADASAGGTDLAQNGAASAIDAVPDVAVDAALVDPGVNDTGQPTTTDVEITRRGGIEEIIVTGQKKAERIQDVPIAISAFSMEDLDNQKIEGGFDLLKNIPNVTFSKTNFSGYNFQIRGIGTQAISATTDPGVAVSFNNTTLIVNRLFEQEYLDIERVEVLRGPQGTLYGRNATGGVINVISAKPKMGVYEGEIKLETGNYGAERIRGHYNLPIGDTVALRGAYASTKRDGYGYNEYSEIGNVFRDPVKPDVDNRDLWTGRLTLGWEPNERLRVNLLYEHFNENDRRVRTSKQLCTRDTGAVIDYVDSNNPGGGVVGQTDAVEYQFGFLSQGCKAGSLYADEAFQTPNGASLPFLSGMYWATTLGGLAEFFLGAVETRGLGGNPYPNPFSATPLLPFKCEYASFTQLAYPIDVCNPDVFRGRPQSRDLRTISSQLEPSYYASSDVYDLSFDYELNENLLLSWQTVYATDEYYATQDYNRFTAFPIWEDSSAACDFDSSGFLIDCSAPGSFANGFYANLSPRPAGSPLGTPGVLCDPQLGCSDTLLIQDLSRAESKQFNQELRLVSSFDGAFNFSLGANYTSFETMNDYFVFSNAFTHLLNFFPFQHHASPCVVDGTFCRYVDPHSIDEIIDGQGGDGHNYFRNGNPYQLRSAALFGELYWQATERLKLTTGLRFTWDRKVFTPLPSELLLGDYREATGPGLGGVVFVPPGSGPDLCNDIFTSCPFSGSAPGGRGYLAQPDIVQEWRVPTGRIVLDYQPETWFDWQDQTMVYLSLARGYKGGGANPPSVAEPQARFLAKASGGATIPPTFKPEYVNAIEIGTKNTLLGGGLTLNLSGFYYDYSDYQVSKIVDRTAVNENFDATVWGLELESLIAPTPDTLFNVTIGYLRTRIADGEESIDLMDRTAGGNQHFAADPDALGSNDRTTSFVNGFDEWIVLQPDQKTASNCVAPRELLKAAYLAGRTPSAGEFCPNRNLAGGNTIFTDIPYFDENGVLITNSTKFYDPAKDAPNGGQGFAKDLSGNELPSAPRFTVSLGGQQTFYLPSNWSLTTRLDWYWQDESYARVYNFEPYDRLKAWTNTNLSIWVEKLDWGLKVEAYAKNVFNETPITGAFLNSDDSGLTTNVFTLDPRLFGVSIKKSF